MRYLQTIFSCPKSARESGGTLLLFIFLTVLLGDSNNTRKTIQYTMKIENTRYRKKIHRERKADKKSRGHNRPSANGTQGPVRGTAREMKKETKS